MNIHTPNNNDCPNCHELESTECIVEEQSVPSLGLPAGSRLNTIIKFLDKKIKDFVAKFKKVIYNVEPIFDTGIDIMNYTDESCGTDTLNLKVPLFLNGKECFEYDLETVLDYTDEPAYVLFFNHTHCGGNFIGVDDTIQITHISGVALSTPLVIKAPGDATFNFTNAILQTLLSEVNTLTTSTFTDLVTDTTLTANNDVGLGLVPTANAGATFLGNLTFTYEHLDPSLVLIDTIVENILSRNVTGSGIVTTDIENFSVEAVMGAMTFYDETFTEVTDELEINALIQLIVNGLVRPICCPDCGGSGGNLEIQEEGTPLTATASSINFVGDNITATNVGNDVTVAVNVPDQSISVSDEGTPLTPTMSSINFVGDDVTATNVGNDVTVTINSPDQSIEAQDEGSQLTPAMTSINFTGAGATATNVGGAVTVDIPASGGGADLEIQDEGSQLTPAATSINFTGAGATATNVGGAVTVDMPAAAGGSDLEIQDEGSQLTAAATSINFTGAGATATNVGGAVTVDIPAVSGVYKQLSRVVTQAELLSLHTTPIVLIPATSGTAYFVESALVKYITNTTDYTSTITGDRGWELHKVGLAGYEELMYIGRHENLENLNTVMSAGYTVFGEDMIDANYAGVLANLDTNFLDQMRVELRLNNGQFNVSGDHEIEIILIYKEITL